MAEEDVEALQELVSPKFEATTPSGMGVEPGTYRGLDGARRWLESFQEIMDEIRLKGHDFIAVGDRVVVPHTLHARGGAAVGLMIPVFDPRARSMNALMGEGR